jgi:pyruvate dehydrogenase (quinone)
VAEGFGVKSFRLDDPDRCPATLDEALAYDGPALVDAVVDANEPMLPPKRREEYVRKLTLALQQGTERVEKEEIERALGEEPALTSLRP